MTSSNSSIEELAPKNQAWRKYCIALGVYNALRSQGKHCPEIAIDRAMAAADEAYDSWKAISRMRLGSYEEGQKLLVPRQAYDDEDQPQEGPEQGAGVLETGAGDGQPTREQILERLQAVERALDRLP